MCFEIFGETKNLGKKLVILDLDQTLVDTNTDADLEMALGKCFEVVMNDGKIYKVAIRPWTKEFIDFCFENFEVAVWTAAQSEYAEKVVDLVFGDNKERLLFLWSRKSCQEIFVSYYPYMIMTKPLCFVWEKYMQFDESNTVIVDDNPDTCIENEDNAIVINPWNNRDMEEDNDLSLLKVVDLLDIHRDNDFRIMCRSSRRIFGSTLNSTL